MAEDRTGAVSPVESGATAAVATWPRYDLSQGHCVLETTCSGGQGGSRTTQEIQTLLQSASCLHRYGSVAEKFSQLKWPLLPLH